MSSTASVSDPEDHERDPDVVADEALIDAYRRLPLDPELVQSVASLAAFTGPEW